jgi:hypothetical protein
VRRAVSWVLVGRAGGGRQPTPPISFVTLDTTRTDYLSTYGSARVSTPGLDRLASAGVVFEQAVSVAPLTLPAHSSLFTGLLPPRHGVRDNADRPLEEHQTLAEILRSRLSGLPRSWHRGAGRTAACRRDSMSMTTAHHGPRNKPRAQRPVTRLSAGRWMVGEDGGSFYGFTVRRACPYAHRRRSTRVCGDPYAGKSRSPTRSSSG